MTEASETTDAAAAPVAAADNTAEDFLPKRSGALDKHDADADAPRSSTAVKLVAGDTADEVQQMATQVLKRRQGVRLASVQHAPHVEKRAVQDDPLQLLKLPERNLRARKEQLAMASSNSAGGSARVAAVKEELAGVQARLRDALGLQPTVCDEVTTSTEYYQSPHLKRVSYELSSGSSHGSTAECLSVSGSSKGLQVPARASSGQRAVPAGPVRSTPAAPTYKKQTPGQPTRVATAAGSNAVKAQAAGAAASAAPIGVELPCSRIYYDTASEVAELAARVLKKHSAAQGSSA